MMNNKIRILEAIRQGKIGGGETHLLDLVQRLDKSRFEPVVLSFTHGPMIDRLDKMGVKSFVIPTERPFDVTTWGKVKNLIKEEKIDIVHAHGTRANSNTFWAARQLDKPSLYTVHGWSFHLDQDLWTKTIRQQCEKFLTQNNSKVICVSHSTERDGRRTFGLNHSCVINNGIDLQRFNTENKYKDLRKSWGISTDVTLVGYIARITKQKDPYTMIRGFKMALEKAPNMKLLVVGDGEMRASSLHLAKQLGIDDHVIFENFRQDISNILKAIDIYCLPSLWEAALPIGAMEAMAMRKAIIVTQLDCMKEVIEHKKNGLLIPLKSPEKLAEKILLLHYHHQLRLKLGQNAFHTATRLPRFKVNNMVREVEMVYANIFRWKNSTPLWIADDERGREQEYHSVESPKEI